ncbi:MAG: endonuclease/exonuclease/phosphatase family protein [Bdellovibrio sp.]|nr:endonuclease/exonuclease/phosphatase family protein [Bdellovibrio sp.]
MLIFLLAFALNLSAQTISPPITLVTYNLGLAHGFVDLAKERRVEQEKILPKVPADIFCMQEVWSKKDRKAITRAMAKQYPFSIVPKIEKTKANRAPVCKISDLFGKDTGGEPKIVTCFQTKCKGLQGQAFTSCVINDCRASLENLKQSKRQCAQALMAQVGKNPTLAMLQLLSPLKKVDLFTYKGSNGLMLFSKYPFGKQGLTSMRELSTLTRRDFLYAEVDLPGGALFVGCTHPSANLAQSAPYTGPFRDWEEENAQQMKFIDEKISLLAAGKPMAILGDFNFGPSFPEQNIVGEFEKNYWDFVDTRYLDPIVWPQYRACTYCNSNSLNKPTDGNNIIDHILLKNIDQERVLKTSLFMTERVSVERDKRMIETHLSDHFGVMLELQY